MSEAHEWMDDRGWRHRAVRVASGGRDIFERFLQRPEIDDGFRLVGCEYSPASAEMLGLAAEVAALRALVAQQAAWISAADHALSCAYGSARFATSAAYLEAERLGAIPACDCGLSALLANPAATSAIAWLEEERRKAVRETLERLQSEAHRRFNAEGGSFAESMEDALDEAIEAAGGTTL